MTQPHYSVRLGKVNRKNTRFDMYRDDKKVLEVWSGGRIVPRKLQAWADQLNNSKHDNAWQVPKKS
jgi:hypothetical protein